MRVQSPDKRSGWVLAARCCVSTSVTSTNTDVLLNEKVAGERELCAISMRQARESIQRIAIQRIQVHAHQLVGRFYNLAAIALVE